MWPEADVNTSPRYRMFTLLTTYVLGDLLSDVALGALLWAHKGTFLEGARALFIVGVFYRPGIEMYNRGIDLLAHAHIPEVAAGATELIEDGNEVISFGYEVFREMESLERAIRPVLDLLSLYDLERLLLDSQQIRRQLGVSAQVASLFAQLAPRRLRGQIVQAFVRHDIGLIRSWATLTVESIKVALEGINSIVKTVLNPEPYP